MLLIGLTGSIAMGKTTTAAAFAACGVPVFDADQAVHDLYRGKAAPLVEAAFPGTLGENGIDRQRLGALVLGDPEALRRLEAIVHPLVRAAEGDFLRSAVASGRRMVLLDVPLLLESGGESRVDVVVVVSASAATQRQRILARPGMTSQRLQAMLARQMPDGEKRRRAHFVVETERSIEEARRSVVALVRALQPLSAIK